MEKCKEFINNVISTLAIILIAFLYDTRKFENHVLEEWAKEAEEEFRKEGGRYV